MSNLNRKIYKISIYSIDKYAPQPYVKKDYSAGLNLRDCNCRKVVDILAYDSVIHPREIITNKKIPWFCGKHYRKVGDEKVFFKFEDSRINGIDMYSLLANIDEIEKYLKDNLNAERYNIEDNYISKRELKKMYLEYLNNIFKQARDDYDEVLECAPYSTQIREIKLQKKNNKIKLKELKKKYL